jgi:hypothetical protein
MKNWTPLNWITYTSLGTSSILTVINAASHEGTALSGWLSPFIKTYVLGYGPAIFFMIATVFFITEWRRSKKSQAIINNPPVPVIPHKQSSSIQLKKFYSERNKHDLADALTDLIEIFNRDGSKLIQNAQRIIEEWRSRGMQDIAKKPPDIGGTIDQLNEMGNLAATLYRDLFEDNGFIKKYQAYDDELCKILQVHKIPSQTSNQPLIELQSEINFFRNMLTPIKLAEKYNDKNLTTWMMTNTSSTFRNFQHKNNTFRSWIDNTQKNIVAFRNSHLN